MTEQEIIEGCKRNDRKAQEYLYRKYFSNMMHWCFRYTRDEDAAVTIVNNGFLRVFKKVGLYTYKGSFEGWMRRLMYNAMADHFRKNARYVQFMVLEERERTMPGNGLDQLYAEDILRMIDHLPPATRQVFQLYAIEGYTHKEIGEQLDISDGTSKWHLSMARQKLKELIKEQQDYDENQQYA